MNAIFVFEEPSDPTPCAYGRCLPLTAFSPVSAPLVPWCWISEGNYMNALVYPVCVSTVLNMLFLINILRVLLMKLRAGPAVRSQPSRSIRQAFRNGSHTDINIRNVTLHNLKLDLTKLTMFYIHGYLESVDSESVITVVNASLKTDINVVAIDYGRIAVNNITTVLTLVGPIAQAVAKSFNKLQGSGLDKNKIHVVAHSLGGAVSSEMVASLNFTLPRITGLDAADPVDYRGKILSSGDAEFVDIIHTDKMFYGESSNSGDVDFLPNYGRRIQPGCPNNTIVMSFSDEDTCSHRRSWRFYAESVTEPRGFLGVQCADDYDFQTNACNYSDIIPMGAHTPINARGVYYLHTNSESPFARGLEGTRN